MSEVSADGKSCRQHIAATSDVRKTSTAGRTVSVPNPSIARARDLADGPR